MPPNHSIRCLEETKLTSVPSNRPPRQSKHRPKQGQQWPPPTTKFTFLDYRSPSGPGTRYKLAEFSWTRSVVEASHQHRHGLIICRPVYQHSSPPSISHGLKPRLDNRRSLYILFLRNAARHFQSAVSFPLGHR